MYSEQKPDGKSAHLLYRSKAGYYPDHQKYLRNIHFQQPKPDRVDLFAIMTKSGL
jgi:hypothetical protein